MGWRYTSVIEHLASMHVAKVQFLVLQKQTKPSLVATVCAPYPFSAEAVTTSKTTKLRYK